MTRKALPTYGLHGEFVYGHNEGVQDLQAVRPEIDIEGYVPPTVESKVSFRDVDVVMSDHTRHLVDFIKTYSFVAGCVAWLTSEPILDALATCEAVQIVVQKEDWLRPDFDSRDGWRARLHSQYEEIPGVPVANWGAQLSLCGAGTSQVTPVRVMGLFDPDARKKALPRMHHKFLIGYGPSEPSDNGTPGSPLAVWTGSFNMSANAAKSRENAVIVRDPKVASHYHLEFLHVLGLSEELDWTYEWVVPNLRWGT